MRYQTFKLYYVLLVAGMVLTACKEEQQPKGSVNSGPGKSPQSMIQVNGCTVSKTRGVVSVTCGDGSSSTLNMPASPYYPKDANGTSYPSLLYVDTYLGYYRFYNQNTDNIVVYSAQTGAAGAITQVFFGGPNCTGSMYENTFYSAFGNELINNGSGWNNIAAFKLGTFETTTTVESYWQNGRCTNQTTSSSFTSMIASSMDSGIPANMTSPVSLELAQ